MKTPIVKIRQITQLLGDLLALYGALALSLFIRYSHITRDEWDNHIWPFTILYIIWIAVFYINDLYNINLAGIELARRFALALAINASISVAFFYLVPLFGIAPKTNLIINLTLSTALLTAWRYLNEGMYRAYAFRQKILFIGESAEGQELENYLSKKNHIGYLPVGTIATLELSKPDFSLKNYVEKEKIDIVVICLNMRNDSILSTKLYEIIDINVQVLNVSSFYEIVFSRIPLSTLDEIWFLENLRESDKKVYELTKRVFDVAFSVFMGLFFLILAPAIALAIKIGDKGSIFYKQNRVGKNNTEFLVYKFRTMREGAESAGPQFAKEADTRITKVGKFLRKTRLDELPQIFNILRGEMSVIGPRPERPEFTKEFESAYPFYKMRNLIKPGLTGWAQIYYNYAASLEENLRKLQYDFFYVKNRSILLDLMILLKTLNIVLRLRGR